MSGTQAVIAQRCGWRMASWLVWTGGFKEPSNFPGMNGDTSSARWKTPDTPDGSVWATLSKLQGTETVSR